ncbi:unnamed protein product [Tetraodon nigroviridis]|uniref:Chromosome undetermined SCAF7483, whole genome shotgun sequence n=1 Tax=Tetraodon nigroviridis TaxID=99883 RepID=Q4T9Y8_TETNG|nr:unnamed protein product [Tetraodon nigroviridis]
MILKEAFGFHLFENRSDVDVGCLKKLTVVNSLGQFLLGKLILAPEQASWQRHHRCDSKQQSVLSPSRAPCGNTDGGADPSHFAEQLVLCMKAEEFLSAALHAAKDNITSGQLLPSNTVKRVIRKLNEQYKTCVTQCHSLNRGLQTFLLDKQKLMDRFSGLTAEKLLYSHAVHMVSGRRTLLPLRGSLPALTSNAGVLRCRLQRWMRCFTAAPLRCSATRRHCC